jgi:hypothetical protein
VCYRSLQALERESRFALFAPPLRLKDRFDDKLFQLALFERLAVPTPKSRAVQLRAVTHRSLMEEFGKVLVVQAPTGSSGESTRIVLNRREFRQACREFAHLDQVKVATYLPQPSINCHAVVVDSRSGPRCLPAAPSMQIVGADCCTDRPEIYCGNDFTAAGSLPESVLRQVALMMERVGLAMGADGYRGVFGMDFLTDGTRALALEINPRLQGSSALLAALQAERGQISMFDLHLLQFAGLIHKVPDAVLDDLTAAWQQPHLGAQLIIHLLADQARCLTHDLQGGAVRLTDQGLQHEGLARSCCELSHADGWCLLDNLPRLGAVVHPGARLAVAQSRQALLADDLMSLNLHGAAFARAVGQRFEWNQQPEQRDEQVCLSA